MLFGKGSISNTFTVSFFDMICHGMVCVASGFDVKSIIALWPMRGRFGSGTDYDLYIYVSEKEEF